MKTGSSLPRPQQRYISPYQVLRNSHSNYFFSWQGSHIGPGGPLWLSSITLRHTPISRTPMDEWSVRRRDLWQHTTLIRETSMNPAGFKPAIPASEGPQTQATLKLHWLKIQLVLPIPPPSRIYIYIYIYIYIPRDLLLKVFQLNFVWGLFLSLLRFVLFDLPKLSSTIRRL